jgi:cyclopropane fatty-acyl-phospholipid synthase-like methyltransferase
VTITRGERPAPERVRWAVETLAVRPGDRVLEIGCGSGAAASLVCAQLDGGGMLAIDRSATQIERARRRNEAHVASGRLTLETVALADLELADQRFDKAFAINVNVFWVGPATEELKRLGRALAPSGTLFLFYELPTSTRARQVADRVGVALEAGGFVALETRAPAATRLCLIARPR